jgi:hypothetical protein
VNQRFDIYTSSCVRAHAYRGNFIHVMVLCMETLMRDHSCAEIGHTLAHAIGRNLGLRLNVDVRNSDFVEGAQIPVGEEARSSPGGGGQRWCGRGGGGALLGGGLMQPTAMTTISPSIEASGGEDRRWVGSEEVRWTKQEMRVTGEGGEVVRRERDKTVVSSGEREEKDDALITITCSG